MYQCSSDCMCSKYTFLEYVNVMEYLSISSVQARLFLHFIFNSSLNISLKSFCFKCSECCRCCCCCYPPSFFTQLMRILIFNGLEPVDSINCLLKDFLHFTAPFFLSFDYYKLSIFVFLYMLKNTESERE